MNDQRSDDVGPAIPSPEQEKTAEGDGLDRTYQRLPVVGIGGSAGSLPALRRLLEHAPPDSGLAFVVVVHLSPAHESDLANLLQASTRMKVAQVRSTVSLQADTVYVIPPGKGLRTIGGQLHLTDLPSGWQRHVVVDTFFRALAESHGTHATAVVLSGGDGDGAIGIKRVKEHGGLTIAQEPDDAEVSSMPRAAMGTA